MICAGERSARVSRWGGVPVREVEVAAVAMDRASVLTGRMVVVSEIMVDDVREEEVGLK